MEKKEVVVIWDYPQLTEDPMAIVIDPETGKKIDEATIDCTNFVTGGKLLTPGDKDDGSYTKSNLEEDQFVKDNSEFLELPIVEDRYLATCWGKGMVGVMETCQEIFLKHFNLRYNVKSITKLRKATV
jgi:hypothetical protein